MTDVRELISEAIKKAEDRIAYPYFEPTADWCVGYKTGLRRIQIALDAIPSQNGVANLVVSHGAQHVIDKFRFASAWAQLAMNNLKAREQLTGQPVPDDEITGYISAGGFEGSLQIRVSDIRLLAEAFVASAPAASVAASAPVTGDWTVTASKLAHEILSHLGIGCEPSLEPFMDRRRDRVAAIITRAIDASSPPNTVTPAAEPAA